MRTDLTTRAAAYASLITSRVLCPNEVRELENRPPYEGGDVFVNPNTTLDGGAGIDPTFRPAPPTPTTPTMTPTRTATTMQSKAPSHRAFFGDAERDLSFSPELIVELERKTGAGIGGLCKRLFAGDFRHVEILEIIRLGLIGGGERPDGRVAPLPPTPRTVP